ncbi:hypothetical protein HMPREF1135_00311 [Lachnoanaerobaculum sp. OBRC5-5]|nr:hypothetical protein HMPREF1135_00311 [Lachnoanaerobaculum sp. OBRC5-5]
MYFMNDLGGFLGITSLAGVLSLLLVLYSIIHINPIRYTLLEYDKKVEYSFKRLIISIVFIIFLLFILFSTLYITNDNKFSYFKLFSGSLFLILSIIAIIANVAFIWNLNKQIGAMRYKFWTKIRIICIREDLILPLIASWIGIYYFSLSFSYICKQMPKVSMIIVVLGSVIFIPTLIYGVYKKSGTEQNIAYYYAYEKKNDNNRDNVLYLYEKNDEIFICRYRNYSKVSKEESDKLSKELTGCKNHIISNLSDNSDNKQSIINMVVKVEKYNKHGYIELGDLCVRNFVDKIKNYDFTTNNIEESNFKEELENFLTEMEELTCIKLVDIDSIKDGKIYPYLDNIEKFNNLI